MVSGNKEALMNEPEAGLVKRFILLGTVDVWLRLDMHYHVIAVIGIPAKTLFCDALQNILPDALCAQEDIMDTGNFWKYGLALGAGVLLGAVGVTLLSRGNGGDLKKTAATLLSHGMDLKDKAAEFVETAKENFDDLAAEARHEKEKRKAGEA